MLNLITIVGIIITVVTAIPVVMQLRTHPKGLFVLFFAEMWERFSYYGMRAILVFYLTQQFLFEQKEANDQYGAYTSLVYLLPLLGGIVADRWLGMRKAIAFGALLLVAGHLAMGIEGKPAVQVLTYQGASYDFQVEGRGDGRKVELKVGDHNYKWGVSADGGLAIEGLPEGSPLPSVLPKGGYKLSVRDDAPIYKNIMFLALALIIVGIGFLKSNLSAIVGQLYTVGDPKRDPGFTLYYYGINLGAFWAAILCGYLGEHVGWWAGFGLAGVGMAAGWVGFTLGRKLLDGKGEPPSMERLKTPVFGPVSREWLIYLSAIPAVAVVWVLVQHNASIGWLLAVGSVAILVYLGVYMFRECSKVETQRLILALILVAASVVFFTLFEQAGSSLNLYAAQNSQLTVGFGQKIAASQTQSFNAGFILIFAPIFSALWAYLGTHQKDPSPALKFGFGLIQVGLGFLILVFGIKFAGPDFKVPLIFLFLAYLFHTTGELCLSPVGLSEMTKLSPAKVISTIMAVWFLASSWAQFLAGIIAGRMSSDTVAGQVLDPGKALETYGKVFLQIGVVGVAVGVVMCIASPWLKKLAHGASDSHAMPKPELDGDRQSVDPKAL
jgi:POT family proton-dependent oligopeptide transporter